MFLKKIVKKPFFWLLLTLFGIFVFLYFAGFKITYAPSLENNWDAISGVAAWASVVLSFVAICAAIYVPYKVAKEQNKISLLEKRIKIYIDFVEMFNSQISWPLALCKACGTNIKRINVWQADIENVFTTAGFLFSPELKAKIVELKELYSKIRWHDQYIEIGLEAINDENEKNIILKLFSKECTEEITESELAELKSLTKKHEFVYDEGVGVDERYTPINLHILSIEQDDFANKAKKLQNIILEKMKDEIQISKN